MLQRIHDSLARWIALLLLGLVSVGFIFWRADFGSGGTATFAANVNGEKLSLTEFDRELQARQNQYQQLYRTELNEEMRREMRRSVIEAMVRDAVLKQRVDSMGYRVSNERLTEAIRTVSAFQVDGKFSMDVYRGLLANQGMTPTGFEALQRESLEVRELQTGIAESTFLTPAEFRRYIELFNQRREVGYASFPVDGFRNRVTLDDAAISTHYDSNQASYQTNETVDLQYIELALADIAASIDVSDEALRTAYDEEHERFQTAEERHARHILVAVENGDEDAARAKAQGLVDRLNKGEDFAALASEFSTDAGTKAQGGDLGWIGRGMLVGPFEDALFQMQAGDVRGPVRSDFGYHVIRLDELRAGTTQSFEAVRDELATELKTRRAEQQFYDRANQLGDKSFDAYNELATVASEMQLPLKTIAGFPRTGDAAAFTNSAAVVQAAFEEQMLESGKNSALVELADDHVVVLRVTAHHLPTVKPLAEVQDQIKEELTRAQAEELSEQAAIAFLAAVKLAGADPSVVAAAQNGTWSAPAWVERTDASVPTEVLAAAFALPKPAAGAVAREQVALANGSHAVLALSNVQAGAPDSVAQTERDQRQRQLADQSAYAEITSYVGTLREQATVRIPNDVLDPKY
jgi:peptidyl-prolyl cis-trans isomerase D